MIKSINGWIFADKRPVSEAFKMAKDAGFDGFEIVLGVDGTTPETHLTLESTQQDCERLRQSADSAGIKLVSSASGLGWAKPISSQNTEVRAAGIAAIKQHLQVAKWLGIEAILVVPGGVGAEFIPGFTHTPYEIAYNNAQAGIIEAAKVGEELGVTIAVENVWNKLLLSPLEMRAFIDSTNSSKVGCYFDVGNVLVNGYPEDWIEILGKRITRVHFKDFKRDIGNIDGFCDLLDGDVDYAAVVKGLRAVGYEGSVTAEFFNAEADLPKISQAMDKILAM